MGNQKQFISGLLKAWRDEMLSARNYHALAERETNPEKRKILERMAEAEEQHAERWAKRLGELGAGPGAFSETFLERVRRWVLLRSDTNVAARMLEAGESEADKLYDVLLTNAQNDADRRSLTEAQRDERAHNRVLEEFEGPSAHLPQSKLETILRREKWHVRAGGWIGQAIYGVNDGLGAAFGVVSGVAGAPDGFASYVIGMPAKWTLGDFPVWRPVERQAHMLQFIDGRHGLIAHELDGILIAQVIRALYGVVGVPFGMVFFLAAERRADAALGSAGV